MRKIFGILVCTLVLITNVYAKDDIPTEKQYTFDRENVAIVLTEFIEDEKLALKAADKYNELSREGGEKISAVDFVDVCVAGGMNIKAIDGSGYTKCLEMFMRLIEMQNQDIGSFNMYCPATGNTLKSITDKTKIGEICGETPDTYIEFGYVTIKALGSDNKSVKIKDIKNNKAGEHQYVCTCTPQACKPGYHWDKNNLKCVNGKGYCDPFTLNGTYNTQSALIRSSQNDSEWDSYEKNYSNEQFSMADANATAFNKCVEAVNGKACTIRSGLAKLVSGSWTNGKYQIVCNISDSELENWQKQELDKYKTYKEKQKKHEEELAEQARYYEVCDSKYKDKGTCIDNVFTNKFIGGTQVSYAVGNALVKEYMRVNGYNGVKDEITCGGDNYDKNIRKETIAGMRAEYYIKCKSLKDATKYYEFKFDDLEESKDLTANTSVYNAVWHIIYDYHVGKGYMTGYDTKTKANCDAVGETFKKICKDCGTVWRQSGYADNPNKYFCYDKVYLPTDTCKKSPNDLNTAFDMDPFVFCKNTHNQLKNTGSMESLLKQYISDKSGYNVSKIECYPQTLCYSGTGCGGVIGHGDDIKTCVVHGDKDYTIDFVFDDVNEFSKKLNKGALQSMACVVSKGTFTGQECIVANKEQCDALIKSTSQICPECKKAKWNPTTKLCELPDAKTVTQLEKGKTIAMIVGGTVVVVGVTIITVGQGTPVVVIVLSGLEVVGGGIELGAQIHIDGMAHDFLLESVKCQDASCAERLIKENMQSLANITNDMQDYEINAVDEEFARLLKLIPEDSAFYQRIVENGAKLEDNKKGFFDPEGWNQAQVWRAIGIGLQFSSLTTGVIKKLIEAPRFANKFPKMQKVLMAEVKLAKNGVGVMDEDVAKILLRNDKIAQENYNYVKQVENSGPEGKRWVILWREYAPKNESLKHFQESFGNDLAKAEKNFQGEDVSSLRREYLALYDDYEKKHGNTYYIYKARRDEALKKAEIERKEVELPTSKTKGLESWSAEQLRDAEKLYRTEEFFDLSKSNNLYSTYDYEVARINKETKNSIEELDEEIKQLQEDYKRKHGNISGFENTPEYKEWSKKRHNDLPEEYQYKMGQVALPNKAVVSQEMAENLDRLLLKSSELSQRLNSWSSLSENNKLTLLDDILRKYAVEYNTPYVRVSGEDIAIREADGFRTAAYYRGGKIVFNTEASFGGILDLSEDYAISTLMHEYGHAIDHLKPSKGSVGSQIMKGLGKDSRGKDIEVYTSKGKTYVLAPTEQSSYSNSGAVLESGNWPLNNAKKTLETERWEQLSQELMNMGYDADAYHHFPWIKQQDFEYALSSGKFNEYANGLKPKLSEIQLRIWTENQKQPFWKLEMALDYCSELRNTLDSLANMEAAGYKFGTESAETLTETLNKFGRDRLSLFKKVRDNDVYGVKDFARSWENQLSELRELWKTASAADEYMDVVPVIKDLNKADGYIWQMKDHPYLDELEKLINE